MIEIIILDNGYGINNTSIDNSIIYLNNEWVKIFILTTDLTIEEIENLCMDNKEFIYGNNTYVSDGYIKSIDDGNGKTKTWIKLKYKYKNNKEEMDNLNNQILELQKYISNKEYEELLKKGGVK